MGHSTRTLARRVPGRVARCRRSTLAREQNLTSQHAQSPLCSVDRRAGYKPRVEGGEDRRLIWLVRRYLQPGDQRSEKYVRFPHVETLGVNRPTPKLRREMALRRAKTRFWRPSLPQPHTKNPQISWGSTRPIALERKMGWWSLERAMGFEPTTPTLARLCSTPELRPHSIPAVPRARFYTGLRSR